MNSKLQQNIYPQGDFNQIVQPEKRPGVPVCPLPNSLRLFGRAHVIAEIVARLTSSDGVVAVSAVRGLPGVGKSDLLRAVGCDPTVTSRFKGGVLYAELGPSPDPLTILARWLRELDQEVPQSDDPQSLAAVARRTLGDRPALLIIDDVWQESYGAARVLHECASPASSVLASSRSPEIADALAGSNRYTITLPVLDDTPALDLLREHAENAVAKDEVGAVKLVEALGKLPLALKLAANVLKNDRRSKLPCTALLETWQQRLEQLRGYERREGMVDEQLSLDAIIGMSYAALPDDATRTAAAALSVLGATPLTWNWDAMAAVWQVDDATMTAWEQSLIDSGLLDFDDKTQRYSLHQTIQAFLVLRCTNTDYAERHATYYAALMQKCDNEIDHEDTIDNGLAKLDGEIAQMERGQAYAASATMDDTTIGYAFASAQYFLLRGRYELILVWSKAGRAASGRQGKEHDEANLLGNLGINYRLLGRHADAIHHHQQSLDISRRIGNLATAASQLNNLGVVYQLQGRYNDAISHFQQSLDISKSIDDVSTTAMALGNLGNVYQALDRYDDAISHFQQSLDITRCSGDVKVTANTLGNLGIVYQARGHYNDAITYFQQSLDIRQRIGDVSGVAETRWNLGMMYEQKGNLEEALQLIEQCVVWEEQIGHPDAVRDRAHVEELRARIAAGEE